MYKKYFSPCVKYTLIYLFLPLIYFFMLRFAVSFYGAVADAFPGLFKHYNPIADKELYERQFFIIQVCSVLLSVALISYIPSIFDNARYESVISRTDGYYRVKNEIIPYIKRNLGSDIIASGFISTVFVIFSSVKLPEKAARFLEGYLSPHTVSITAFGIAGAILIIFTTSLLSRLAAVPFALCRFRALWLTSFVDE